MKEQHIQWASRHDWYIGHGVNVENKVFIRVKERLHDDIGYYDTSMDFTNFQTLREWAGY